MSEQYLTTSEVSQRLSVNVRTLERWRQNHTGPAYAKINGRVLYSQRDIEAWFDENRTL